MRNLDDVVAYLRPDNETFKEILSERDLAIEKIATLMEQIDDAKREISSLKASGAGKSPRNSRRGSMSPENPKRAGPITPNADDGGAAKKMVATAAEKMAKLKHENAKLRTRLKGIKTAKIVGDVKDLIGTCCVIIHVSPWTLLYERVGFFPLRIC